VAESFHCLAHQLFSLCRLAQIGGEKSRATTECAHLFGHSRSRSGLTEGRCRARVYIMNDDIGSRLHEVQGVVTPQPATRARHQRDFPDQIFLHALFSFVPPAYHKKHSQLKRCTARTGKRVRHVRK
jgi:hypothetical protein